VLSRESVCEHDPSALRRLRQIARDAEGQLMQSRASLQAAVAELPVGTRPSSVVPASVARRLPHPAWFVLAGVIAFGVVQTAIRYHESHLGIHGDMYGFLLEHEGLNFHTLLQPYNEDLSAFTVLLYRGIGAFVGVTSAVPYIAANLLFMSACAILAYVFVRRDLGPWVAWAVPLVLMTLGPASELSLAPEFSLYLGLSLWLGALLLLRRGEKRTDLIACALLVLGIGTHAIVIALLPATALALLFWTGWPNVWRRAWTLAVPLALYVAWNAAYHPSIHRRLGPVPAFVVNSFVASVEDLSGIGNHAVVVALAAVVFAAACLRCLYLRRVPTLTVVMGVALVSIWAASGLNEGLGRVPNQSRYQFHNALLLSLALAPLVPRFRLTALRSAALAAVVGAIVVANMNAYTWQPIFEYQDAVANAQLAAVQVARPAVANQDEVFTTRNGLGLYWPFSARAYFKAIDEHGSPVSIHRDLELASPSARHEGDRVLVNTERILVPGTARVGKVRPHSLLATPLEPVGPGCARIPSGTAALGLDVVSPPGGLVIRAAAGPPVEVGVGRFSEPPASLELNPVPGGSESERVPARQDASNVPWRFRLTGKQAVTVCSGAE
jgi:hypothetical protein